LLVEHFGIAVEQFFLADISPVMPDGFSQAVFDMCKPWPEVGQFDYTKNARKLRPLGRR